METFEKRIDGRCVYDGKIIRVIADRIELPDGSTSMREVVEHSGGVGILPVTEDGEIVMVRQFRYPYGEVLLEIPAGKLNSGESPLSAGKRELLEETGVVAESYVSLGEMYPTSGYCAERISLFLAKGLSYVGQNLDDDEFLNVERLPFDKLLSMVMKGEIRDGKTQIALLKYKEMQNEMQDEMQNEIQNEKQKD